VNSALRSFASSTAVSCSAVVARTDSVSTGGASIGKITCVAEPSSSVLLLNLVATWNNYFLPLVMLNNPRLFPITVGLAQWNAQATAGAGSQALFNLIITGSVLSIIPLIAAFLFLQRYWQSGLTLGGVKG